VNFQLAVIHFKFHIQPYFLATVGMRYDFLKKNHCPFSLKKKTKFFIA